MRPLSISCAIIPTSFMPLTIMRWVPRASNGKEPGVTETTKTAPVYQFVYHSIEESQLCMYRRSIGEPKRSNVSVQARAMQYQEHEMMYDGKLVRWEGSARF